MSYLTGLSHLHSRLSAGLTAFAMAAAFSFIPATAQAVIPAVKKSNSGICHPEGSRHYGRTKNFVEFDSLQACIDSGGRLPKGVSLVAKNADPAPTMGYERSKFGHGWLDSDGDCQDGRAEALIALSTTSVRFADERQCRVTFGRWISPFTGEVIQDASELDADHIVPLKWAYERGAQTWAQGKREAFANDLLNIWPVEASLNRSKGARGPDQWLPPAGQCQYVARFVRIGMVYGLTPTTQERATYRKMLDNCKSTGRVGG